MHLSDTCVSTGVGLRWALTGPFMTNASGGGGGKDGFRQLLTHLGPALQGWLEDMDSHAFTFSEENIQKLDDSVQDMLERTEIKDVESQRDKALVDFIKRKKDAPSLK